MNKFSTRFLIVVSTFVIGISSVAGWFYYQESQKPQLILPNSTWEPIFFNGMGEYTWGINQRTKLAGLTELRKTIVKKGDLEVRIWRGFGLGPLEAVFLKRVDGQWSALHLNEVEFHNKAEVNELNPPKSGWETLWQQLVDKEILTLRDSSEIGCGEGGIDGTGYVVEINRNKIYRTYMLSESYSQGECREVNQMEEIGDIIGEEFDSGTQPCKRAEWFACTKARKLNKQTNQ